MAKVIEFYARDLPNKVKQVRLERRGKLIELPRKEPAVVGKTAKVREHDEASPIAVSWPGCF